MRICQKMCDDCPFSRKSMRGFLGGYEVEELVIFFQQEVLFACHKQVSGNETVKEMESKVRKEKVSLCRGYVEAMRKSCKVPRNSELAAKARDLELSEDSMDIFEFATHHRIHRRAENF